MTVSIKSYNQRLGVMVRKILTDTGLSDLRVGSVISAILQAAAQSDFEIETSIVEMIKLFSIDTTEGADLDRRAAEYNIKRYTALPSTDVVRIGDSSFTKKSSKIYIGLPPPVVGDVTINVEDASDLTATGQVYVGRGTGNYEGPISYSSLTNNTSYWSINLTSPIARNHTGAEFVTLAQGGNRTVTAGTLVKSPANNFSPAVNFYVTRATTLVDGETLIDNVPVVATTVGTVGNVPTGSIREFSSSPFTGATVTNITVFTSGRDIELDSALRGRMRNAIQLIARGTSRSILEAVNGVSDSTDNKRVTSASLTEPINTSTPAQLYIDDGTGFEPSFTGQGVEQIVSDAAGSEQMMQVAKFPITPPMLVATIDEPYGVQVGDTLVFLIDNSQETITFVAADFDVPGAVKARELINAINSQATYITARSARNGSAIAVLANRFSDGIDPETLSFVSGTANDSIQFPITPSRVMSLYNNGVLLKKNPASAIIYSLAEGDWIFGSGEAAVLSVQVDSTPIQTITFYDSDFTSYGTTYKTAAIEEWAEVIASKIAGISAEVESDQIKMSSNRVNSSSSILAVLENSGTLGARATASATWQSVNTIRYAIANTTNIIVGDYLTISHSSLAINDGRFLVTKVATNEFVDVTNTGRSAGTDDETHAGIADPKKEDLALVLFNGNESSTGSTSEYALNRFSGEFKLVTKLSSGDNVTAGSEYTRAYIDSILTGNGRYNFPLLDDITPAIYVAINATCAIRTILIAEDDVLTQTRDGATDNIILVSNRTDAFADVVVGDFVYISTKSVAGTGVYSTWFPSYLTGIYEVTNWTDGETIQIRNPDTTIAGATKTGIVGTVEDIQIFSTDGMIQRIPLLTTSNLTPGAVADQVNLYLQFGEALVFNNQRVRLQSNSFTSDVSKIFVLATAGTAKTLYLAGTDGTANQPHIGFQIAATEGTTYPRMKNVTYNGFLGYAIAKNLIFGSVTTSSLVAPYANIDSTKTYIADIKVDDEISYSSGINQKQSLSIRTINSNISVTPQSYSIIRPIFKADEYIVSESHKFSPYDNLIVELDQDSTDKTFLIPMYRTGIIKGSVTTTTFDGYDSDSAPGTDFNNAMWQDFTFQDFSLMFRARNVYKAGIADSAMVIRSTIYGEVGEGIKFSILYPTIANQGIVTTHQVLRNEIDVNLFLSSGTPRTGISAVGAGYKVTRSGYSLTLDYAGVGAAPGFSTNGVIAGDIANVSDTGLSGKSSYFIGSGKVASATPTQLVVTLSNTTSISTSYIPTSAQDSGSGTTTTYLLANTGLLGNGDKVQIAGFGRSINNGTFTIVGVTTNTSIIVSNSNRTLITKSTIGYRNTTTAVSLQFSGSLTGLVVAGDQVVISGMSDASLNGTFIVTSITTTSIASDTINFTSGGASTAPVARNLTDALWQAGNTVRYASTNTGGISIGNYVDIAGFLNASNNGNFLVSNVVSNTYIEVTSGRANNTDDETRAATARPTYFMPDTGGVVYTINNETSLVVTTAMYLSGNDVRYACTKTSGIIVGNYVTIAGFVNGSNNGAFLVTGVSTNTYIQVTTARANNADDETGPVAGTAKTAGFTAATADLVILQVNASGIAAFPLGTNTTSSIVTAINADPIVNKVITAVNALSYLGTGVITKSTFDELASVGYGHTPGVAYIQLYDGRNYVLDFTSATVNIYKNFTLKRALTFSHTDYNPSTVPNIAGESAGEYFKLCPTTYRNVNDWMNKSNVTSFSIAGSAVIAAEGGGKLQLSSQTVGTAGAIKITGGSANGIASFLKIPSSVDTATIRCQVNAADMPMCVIDQVVKVQNYIASRKLNNFIVGDRIGVENTTGTTGLFKAKPRTITLSTSSTITTSDVSVASYGRASGVWRWTVGTAGSFVGAQVGDVLVVSHGSFSAGNRTPTTVGNGVSSFFPIVGVGATGSYIDIHNPLGTAQGPITLSGTRLVDVYPTFFIEWKHKLTVSDVMSVSAVGLNDLFKYTWESGSTSPLFAQNGACIDDYVIVSGNTFSPVNRGTFRIVAVADTYFVVENALGIAESSLTVAAITDIKFLWSESAIIGDDLNVSDLVFLESNRGTFEITNYGTSAAWEPQLELSIVASTTESSVTLTGLANTFFVTDGILFSAFRKVVNFAIDPTSNQNAIIYLEPATNYHKISNSFNTSITPVQKFGFSSDVAIGVDGYRYYTGLLATVQKVVDGYDPDPVNYPGYKAAGTQIETVPPLIKSLLVNVIVKTSNGINVNTVSDSIKSSILNYIKNLGVGADIIISEITAAVMSVEGIESATLFDPLPTVERIVIQDNEKAVISIDQITVSSN